MEVYLAFPTRHKESSDTKTKYGQPYRIYAMTGTPNQFEQNSFDRVYRVAIQNGQLVLESLIVGYSYEWLRLLKWIRKRQEGPSRLLLSNPSSHVTRKEVISMLSQ